MTLDIALTLLIILAALVLFATEKLRVDVVALLVLITVGVLGLIPLGQTEASPPAATPDTLTGADVAPLEVEGVFNSLTRLCDALMNNDITEIQRAIDMMDEDINRLTFGRAESGAREQSLDVLERRLEDENVDLQNVLSLEIDTDIIEAASRLTALQTSFEASLRTIAQSFQLSLLDFL